VRDDLLEYKDLDPSDPSTNRKLSNFMSGMLWKSNLTAGEFVSLYRSQDKLCGICRARPRKGYNSAGREKRKFEVDHDHRSWEVRGLLCTRCNSFVEYYDRHASEFEAYIQHPPALKANLKILVNHEFRRQTPEPTKATLRRCQQSLDNGMTTKELQKKERLKPATLTSYFRKRWLTLPDRTIVEIRSFHDGGLPFPAIAKRGGVSSAILRAVVDTDPRAADLASSAR
jgi:hypothetical protein